MGEKYEQLVKHLADVYNLDQTASVLHWDMQTQMPPGGFEARAGHTATLSRLRHEIFTSENTARLLEDAAQEVDGAPYDSVEASMIRVVKQDYEEAVKLPAEFVAELTRVTTLAHDVWAKARQNDDFRAFQPMLQQIVDLTIQRAEYLGYQEQPYDALLNEYERGMTTAQVKQIFDTHKPPLVALIAAISERQDAVSDAILHQEFDVDKQREFALDVAAAFGYDLNRGRLDVAVHPFATRFSRNDVRITTRFSKDFLNPALFGTLHESGHAMYEQGSGAELEGTLLSGGTSLGVHESQSRMWENVVGRSKAFWTWALPRLKEVFPNQLGGVDLNSFYKAINKVERSFIRVEADEATYNLHIMLRFELEVEMVAGKVKVPDLPEEWNSRFEAFFGIAPPNDRLGVLQDVHWSGGSIGYFATYALGNLLAAQYYNQALKDRPSISEDIARGKFDTLLTWLNENIHRHGRKYTLDELTRRVTGEAIQPHSYMKYLQDKYGEIYGL